MLLRGRLSSICRNAPWESALDDLQSYRRFDDNSFYLWFRKSDKTGLFCLAQVASIVPRIAT